MASELLQVAVAGASGLERDIIVTAAMPLFQLHRVLQFCIKPNQSDDTVAAQASVKARLFEPVQMLAVLRVVLYKNSEAWNDASSNSNPQR